MRIEDAIGKIGDLLKPTKYLQVLHTSDDLLVTSIGMPADTPASNDTGLWSLIALFKRLLTKFSGPGLLADTTALPTTSLLGAVQQLFNGTTLDLMRGNTNIIVLPSAARTTAQSVDLTNYNARGLLLYLSVTAASGTGGLTVRVRAKDPISGLYYQLNNAPTAIAAITSAVYMFYPGATVTNSNANQVVGNVLPRDFNIQVSVGDASSYTYSINACLII